MIMYEEVLRAFQREKVKYIIVGGMAFNLLGGYRNTLDMDILAEMSDENLTKIVHILKQSGYRVKLPVDPMKLANKKIRESWIKDKHMKAFNFYKGENSFEEVDIIIDSPVDFAEATKDMIKKKIDDLTIPVISIGKLIEMKKKSKRDKDLLDIKELNFIRKLL